MDAIPPPDTTFTMVYAMMACGLSDKDVTTFATDIFMDDLQTCRDISNQDVDDALKTFSTVTAAQGQIQFFSSSESQGRSIKLVGQIPVQDSY